MKKILFLLFIAVLFYNQMCAQGSRPKVGLVLSGGGAKGLVHIGVLKVLESHGIRPDYITGTSMGAIVGGLYASGYSANELEQLVKNINWDFLLTDKIFRDKLSIEEKDDDGKYFLSLPIENFSVKLPKGLVSGQNLSVLLRELFLPVNDVTDFSELPIPFACFATDIVNGNQVKLDKGFLPEAIRASMSIPSVFTPTKIDNHLLVDGGITNNFPVEAVIEMGADIVIGIDVGTQMVNEDKLSSLFSIMDQTLSVQSNEFNKKQQNLCDILLIPDLGEYGTGSFSATDSLIQIGIRAANEKRGVFEKLSAKLNTFPTQKPLNIPAAPGGFQIFNISIFGQNGVSSKLIQSKLNLENKTYYTIKDLEDAILRLYGSQYFERVDYTLKRNGIGMDLLIRVIEKSPASLHFGVHYDQNTLASIRLNSVFRNLITKGSKLSIKATLGTDPEINATYFFQTGWKQDIGIETEANFSNFDIDIYDEEIEIEDDGERESIGEANLDIYSVGANLRANLSRSFLIGAGIKYEHHNLDFYVFIDRYFGDKLYTLKYDHKEEYGLFNYFGYLKFDTFDKSIYPTKGVKLKSTLEIVPGLKRDLTFTNDDGLQIIEDQKLRDFWRLHTDYQHLFKITDRLTIGYRLRLGINSKNEIPSMYQFILGGNTRDVGSFVPFSGLRLAEHQTFNFLMTRIHLQYRLFDKTYIVYYGDIARSVDKYDQLVEEGDVIKGYTLTLGYETFIGPIEFSVMGKNNSPHTHSQISVGLNF